jgi:hypothetical protein
MKDSINLTIIKCTFISSQALFNGGTFMITRAEKDIHDFN